MQDLQLELIKEKIWNLVEKSGGDCGDLFHVIGHCSEYIKQYGDSLTIYAIKEFTCPVCGESVKANTLYSDIIKYLNAAENITLPELFSLVGLFYLMYDGYPFGAVTGSSMCDSCYRKFTITEILKVANVEIHSAPYPATVGVIYDN